MSSVLLVEHKHGKALISSVKLDQVKPSLGFGCHAAVLGTAYPTPFYVKTARPGWFGKLFPRRQRVVAIPCSACQQLHFYTEDDRRPLS
ncbi:MAG: hypothetical protein ACKO85_21275 [Isosphaeraceae bacterium]